MSRTSKVRSTNSAVKEMLGLFDKLCYSRSAWQVWTDFIVATACAISDACDRGKDFEAREKEYAKCVERLGGVETAAQMFACIVNALEENPEQDCLGDLFMQLNLGNHWKGQFFTPYCVCRTMAAMNVDGVEETIEKKGWASVCDPACGAGATLIAMANTLKLYDVDYQNHVLFVAQDIDRVAGLMCYIQLSLLGCPGYVVIGDSLCNPMVSYDKNSLFPIEKEGQEIWFTPMFNSNVWEMRKKFNFMDMILNSLNPKNTGMAEQADATDLGSDDVSRAGSNPVTSTTN